LRERKDESRRNATRGRKPSPPYPFKRKSDGKNSLVAKGAKTLREGRHVTHQREPPDCSTVEYPAKHERMAKARAMKRMGGGKENIGTKR